MAANELNGLGKVRLSKAFILNSLKTNREIHKEDYLKAIDSYHTELSKKLKSASKAIKKYVPGIENAPVLFGDLDRPIHFLEEYDRAIKLFEASLDDEFLLTRGEFVQYILNNWSWQNTFSA